MKEFCPDCGEIVYPDKDGIYECQNCGYSNKDKNNGFQIKDYM